MRKYQLSLIILFIIALLSNVARVRAQSAPSGAERDFAAAYDAYVHKTMDKLPEIPGVAIVVIKGDRPIYVRAFGMADKEAGTKADVNTMFYIASSTKSFTALSAALLDLEGKIKLDDPLTKYAAGTSLKNPIPDKVTIRDLLIHTSGLTNSALTFRMAYSGESDTKDMAKVFAEATTYDENGYGKYNYTNLGYNVYGVLLQNHLRKKWQDLLQEKIFDPVGMKHTTAYISKAGRSKWNVAVPYIFDPVAARTIRSPLNKTDSNLQSAGGLFASISDMGRWLNLNMNDGRLNGKQIIPAEIIKAAHTGYTQTTEDPPPFAGDGQYGLGWQIGKYRNEKVIHHHGGFPGYRSHVSFMPEKKIAVVVMANVDTAGVGHMLATYAYDWWLRTENLEDVYSKRLQSLFESREREKQQMQADAAERTKRTSQLTKPVSAYAGKFSSEIFGTIEIAVNDDNLAVRMGNMRCVATPFTEKETIRVELIPGSGRTIKFNMNARDQIESITYNEVLYLKG
jgi:CubicO group peptidase (beta-lactamase class C family)